MITMKRDVILEGNELADELLRQLSKEDQIKWLVAQLYVAALKRENRQFISALERVLGKSAEFRKTLREVFENFGFGETAYAAAPGIHTAILEKIIEGWDWHHENKVGCTAFSSVKYHKLVIEEDARECFLFFCKAVKSASESLKSDWIALLYKHINAHTKHGLWLWWAEDLDEWILEEGTPDAVKTVLAGARARIGGSKLVQREIQLAQVFHTDKRSLEAFKLAIEYLSRLRGIEAVAEELWLQVRPANERGDQNTDSPLSWPLDEVRWRTESVNVARLMIKFNGPAEPVAITKIQKLRDGLVGFYNQNNGYSIRIPIAVSGPDNFSYREE